LAVRVPAETLNVTVLPPAVAALAEQAFGPGISDPMKRPDAARWHESLRGEWSTVQFCRRRPHHAYGAHLTGCPWCARVASGKSDPFNPPAAAHDLTGKRRKNNVVLAWLLAALFVLILIVAIAVALAH
jgi:DNA-binding helix-hairpin-helix protein with protein kinase domain